MAQRVQVILKDDFDGGIAGETVAFALDGAEYEMDLSSRNAAQLRDALAPWMARARKTGERRKRDSKGVSEIRVWAYATGHEVTSRERIASQVRDAYEKAHLG